MYAIPMHFIVCLVANLKFLDWSKSHFIFDRGSVYGLNIPGCKKT
jgi:hypothetical protein